MLKNILERALEALWPIFCVACGREGQWWCGACQAKTPIVPEHFCAQCGGPVVLFAECPHCAAAPLRGVTAYFKYNSDSSVGQLIQNYKYRFARTINQVWERVVAAAPVPYGDNFIIIPVPLAPRRLRWRGFNQAEDIANILGTKLNLPVLTGQLKRIRATSQQAALNRAQRLKNVADAFLWAGSSPAPENVILVDDVCTTGATLMESAQALKKAGAKKIWGVVLARD